MGVSGRVPDPFVVKFRFWNDFRAEQNLKNIENQKASHIFETFRGCPGGVSRTGFGRVFGLGGRGRWAFDKNLILILRVGGPLGQRSPWIKNKIQWGTSLLHLVKLLIFRSNSPPDIINFNFRGLSKMKFMGSESGNPRNFKEILGTPENSWEFRGIPRKLLGTPSIN